MDQVTWTGIRTVHQTAAVFHTKHGKVRTNVAFLVEHMGIDTLADIGIPANFCRAEPFHEFNMVGAFDFGHMEMRQVNDAAIVTHGELFGIGNAPEVAGIPLVFAHRNTVGIFFKQMFVRRITVRTFPTAKLHEVSTQFDFALIERGATNATCIGKWLTRVDRRVIDLFRRLIATVIDVFFVELEFVVAGKINRMMIDMGAAMGHPVGNEFAHARTVFDPYPNSIPQSEQFLTFPHGGATVGR